MTIAVPFHGLVNTCHHLKSEQNSVLSWIGHPGRLWECLALGDFRRSSILLRKERPGCTTLHAWFRLTTSDSSSIQLHTFRSSHSLRSIFSFASFSAVIWSLFAIVSIVIAKNVKHIVGPTVMCATSETPTCKCEHSCLVLDSAWCHCCIAGTPHITKLSRLWSRSSTPCCCSSHWRALATALNTVDSGC